MHCIQSDVVLNAIFVFFSKLGEVFSPLIIIFFFSLLEFGLHLLLLFLLLLLLDKFGFVLYHLVHADLPDLINFFLLVLIFILDEPFISFHAFDVVVVGLTLNCFLVPVR